MCKPIVIALTVAMLLSFANICLGQQSYTITVLETISTDDPTASAWGVNRLGQIVGTETTPSGNSFAVFWKHAGAIPAPIPMPTGYALSTAYAINDAGKVVGGIYATNGDSRPYVYNTKGSKYQLIGTERGEAYGINASGQVSGSYNGTGFIYDGTVVTQLPRPDPTCPSVTYGINNFGALAETACSSALGFIYFPYVYHLVPGGWDTVPIPDGSKGGALRGINDNGWSVGYWMDSSYVFNPLAYYQNGYTRWRWDGFSNYYSQGQLWSVNNSGLAVGSGFRFDNSQEVALIYDVVGETWTNLNAVVTNPEVLSLPKDI